MNASAVMVNDHTAFRTDWLPPAGRSGRGVGGVPWTMREMAQDMPVVPCPWSCDVPERGTVATAGRLGRSTG